MLGKGINYFNIIFTGLILIILGFINIFNPKLYVSIVLYKHINIFIFIIASIIILGNTIVIVKKSDNKTKTTKPAENFMMRDNLRLMETEYEMGKTMSIQDNKVEKCAETETFIAKNLPLWVEK